jgi:hypothetical protein
VVSADLPVITAHARDQMKRRQIDERTVLEIAAQPEQVVPAGRFREVRQARWREPVSGRECLVRVVIDTEAALEKVITVYRTSKLGKYWRVS